MGLRWGIHPPNPPGYRGLDGWMDWDGNGGGLSDGY